MLRASNLVLLEFKRHNTLQLMNNEVVPSVDVDNRLIGANPMTLINKSIVDPASFQNRREFWQGETSGKDKGDQAKQMLKGNKAQQRKQISSAIYTLSTSFLMLVSLIVMSAYFCPHSVFNSMYLIEFMCLKSDLIDNSDN